eukprot:TRINITY_DN10481_c0_g1_i2.p1 TRINITY_DN10481_c0_g1~~TRINITY_DN10481_c0_g1_i2.p1  ORF type:complete len:359 (+),score=50.35 TRINITY_DN10481_c0_g1_i2:235-1311(+)
MSAYDEINSFIKDSHDPNGDGMFSRQGRQFGFQKRIIKQNLSYKTTQTYQRDPPTKNKIEEKTVFDKDDENSSTSYKQVNQSKQDEITILQPFSKQLSRQFLNDNRSIQSKTPPIGYYRIKYEIVDRNQPKQKFSVNFNNHQSSKTLNKSQIDKSQYDQNSQTNLQEYKNFDLTNVQNLIKDQVKGYVSFYKFETSKQISRDQYSPFVKKNTVNESSCNVQVNSVNQNSGKYRVLFKTQQPHKLFDVKLSTLNQTINYDYDYYAKEKKSNIYSNTKILLIPFNKTSSRKSKYFNPLPSYMQKNLHSRLNINNLNQKGLESSNYKNGRQSAHSFYSINKSNNNQETQQYNDLLVNITIN